MWREEGCYSDPTNELDLWLMEEFEPFPEEVPNMCLTFRVIVTHFKTYLVGPVWEQSNRILRQYKEHEDYFLRVSFADDDFGKLNPRDLNNNEMDVTFRECLKQGMDICGRHYDFLAFSSSQLRESSLWMFAPTGGLTSAKIRKAMGNFENIKIVGKYAARMGQCFSGTNDTIVLSEDGVKYIDDITIVERVPMSPSEFRRKVFAGKLEELVAEYVFSDGIGKISMKTAEKVAAKLNVREGHVPSAFGGRLNCYLYTLQSPLRP
mmetsp:Transcript_30181/g.33728  ORF Transcript_30181/g.33728 Transcript_30181/m.33728 type:complete len:264 (-) Transcript_30181:729-1520(-)